MMKKMTLAAVLFAALGVSAQAQTAGLSVRDVDSMRPFGDIDVNLTFTDPRTIQAWKTVLSDAQQADMIARCDVMLANADRYDIKYRVFCLAMQGK